jgi:CRP-like cAMP-binding protein
VGLIDRFAMDFNVVMSIVTLGSSGCAAKMPRPPAPSMRRRPRRRPPRSAGRFAACSPNAPQNVLQGTSKRPKSDNSFRHRAPLEYRNYIDVGLNNDHKARAPDLELLGNLKAFSWLSSLDKTRLLSALETANFLKHEVIVREADLASTAHILLAGSASITCLNGRTERVMVALLPPGPIPEFPKLPFTPSRFQIEAYGDCRVGSVSWKQFDIIAAHSSQAAFREFHQNNLQQWYRLLLRGSSFLSLDLHERVGLALLELCTDFGIADSRGTLLRIAVSHGHLANLVGASRPRVTEHLARLERDGLLIRQGHQLIVRVDALKGTMSRWIPDLPIKIREANASRQQWPSANTTRESPAPWDEADALSRV